MKINQLSAAVALAAVAMLAAAPLNAQTPPAQSFSAAASGLALTLQTSALDTESRLKAQKIPTDQQKSGLVDALEGAIAGSGATPEAAIEALLGAQAAMAAQGVLSPPINAAINEIVARIRGFQQLAPSATGNTTGNSAFSSPPTSGGGGGAGGSSDYRTGG